MGLNFDEIIHHQEKVSKNAGDEIIFNVVDSCRIDNSAILSIDNISEKFVVSAESYRFEVAAFVPSAGASTRFILPFDGIIRAIDTGDRHQIFKEFSNLFRENQSQKWFLPELINKFIKNNELLYVISDEEIQELKKILTFPKALFPCNKKLQSFTQIKHLEHISLDYINDEIYIVPMGLVAEFEAELKGSKTQLSFYEQDRTMSTIRFLENSLPILEKTGEYSPVPAGHGALVNLFPVIKSDSPHINALFIRNCDNVTGTEQSVIDEIKKFHEFYKFLHHKISEIRDSLHVDNFGLANQISLDVLKILKGENFSSENPLFYLQEKIFHTPSGILKNEKESLKACYDRPLNILGVVPNTGKDIGGTPVLIELDGEIVKICLELPHASSADQDKFFKNPKLATHFNPVFVYAELLENIECYKEPESPFWLLAKKNWKGQEVTYYETVLYEILGNSLYANCLFVEIPRFLFNPNKTLNDCILNKI